MPFEIDANSATWQNAVRGWESRTGEKFEMERFRDMTAEQMRLEAEKNMDDFAKARHDDSSQVSKVRQAFGHHIGDMQKILTVAQTAGNIAAAFPPAMPVSVVFSAAGRALKAFSDVSAQYNDIEAFYARLGKFLDQLLVIESKPPPDVAFQRCITCVFSCQLEVLGIAQQIAAELRPEKRKGLHFHRMTRTKHWLMALWEGENPELIGACTKMDTAVNELRSLMGFEVFNVVQDVFQISERIETKVDVIVSWTQKFEKIMTETKREKASQDKVQVQSQLNAKGDLSDKKNLARRGIRKAFGSSSRYSDWETARTQLKAQRRSISATFVKDTCKWLVSDSAEYKAWIDGEPSILWLTGNDGVGKTFLAHAAIQQLTASSDDANRKVVASFHFKEDSIHLQSADNALACVVWHIAGSNSLYCRQVAADLEKTSDIEEGIWDNLIAQRFPSSSDERLFLILDGLDEASATQREALLANLAQIQRDGLNISVLITTRPHLDPNLEPSSYKVIEITKTQLSGDIGRLIESRCNALPRLAKFSRKVRIQILRRIKSHADGMLYAEHMLRRLNYIGRESAVLKDLKDPPENLQALYHRMVAECYSNRTSDQCDALKRLFAWLAFSKRPLTLVEAGALIKRTVKDGIFDLDDEIIGRSARLLEIAREDDEDDEIFEDPNRLPEDTIDDIDLDVLENTQTTLTFQERSLREFFRAIDVDEEGLRTPSSTAHLRIFQMCAATIFEHSVKEDDSEKSPMLDYAAKLWFQHLVEVNVEGASQEDMISVLQSLYRVTTNVDNVAATLERHAEADQTYPMPSVAPANSWLHSLKQWVGRASTLPKGTLEPQLEAWVEKCIAHPDDVLNDLARGHVKNCYNSTKFREAANAFTFAAAALYIPASDIKDIASVVQKVFGAFPDLEDDVKVPRAKGTVSWWYGSSPDHYHQAIQYLQDSLDHIVDEKGSVRFYTVSTLAFPYGEIGQKDKAVDLLEVAISALPDGWQEDSKLAKDNMLLLLDKATFLKDLERNEESIAAYMAARDLANKTDQKIYGFDYDDLASLLWNKDLSGAQLMTFFQDLSAAEKKLWFDLVLEGMYETVDHLHEAAKINGKSAIDSLFASYDEYEKTLQKYSSKYYLLQAQKADAYKDVVGDLTKAKELYHKVLYDTVREDKEEDQITRARSAARLPLANLIFDEFRSSTDPAQKKKLQEDMLKVADPGSSTPSLEPQESNTDVMLALMYRALGPSISFQTYMDKTFKTCIAGLRDAVGWNDRSSFRLLAKLLACMEGRERDALIAISCQFSKVDTTVPNVEGSDEDSTADSGQLEEDADPKAADQTGDAAQTDSSDASSKLSNTEEASSTPSENRVDSPNIAKEETPDAAVTSDKATTDGGSTIEMPKQSMVVPHEDLMYEDDAGGVYCDGGCGTTQNRWRQPLYYCIICADCDLCESCYADRIARNRGEEQGKHWRDYCGKDHRYIKGPMKGWQGVKDGVIRIEGEENITFVDWLKGLEEVRWKEAWDIFWRRQADVKDIEG